MKTIAFAAVVGVHLAAAESVNAKESLLEQNRTRMANITPAEYDALTLLIDDSMSTVAVVTTRPAYKTKAKTWENETDTWLQGGVNKKTGETLLQIGGSIFYTDQWRFYEFASYSTLNGPVDAPITANRKVIGCSGGCKFVEDIFVTVSEATLRAIARSQEMWRFRFHAKNGPEWEEEMHPAEVAAFLAKLDAYRARTQRKVD